MKQHRSVQQILLPLKGGIRMTALIALCEKTILQTSAFKNQTIISLFYGHCYALYLCISLFGFEVWQIVTCFGCGAI